MKYLLLLSFCFLFLQGKAQDSDSSNEPDSIKKTVLATYYHRKFEGRRTTSGANPDHGKSVVVKVNDRGPFSKRLAIDLSERAAKQIGIFRKGIAKVSLSYTVE
jgi:rare lipoprotein A